MWKMERNLKTGLGIKMRGMEAVLNIGAPQASAQGDRGFLPPFVLLPFSLVLFEPYILQ